MTEHHEFDGKFIIAAALIVGTLAIFFTLVFFEVPATNRDAVNALTTAWLTVGFATMIKFVFDGTKSGDAKNQTIADQAKAAAASATTAAVALGAAPPAGTVDQVNIDATNVAVTETTKPA